MTPSIVRDATLSALAQPDERTTRRAMLRVHADRGVPDEAASILADGLVAHVAFAVDAQPFVIPMSYHFDVGHPTRVYLHGGHHSRLVRHLAAGAPVCIEVTLVGGRVYSRTALYHSMNYRSVVVFGRAAPTPSVEVQRAILHDMVARYHPGRTAGRDYDAIPDAHLVATAFIEIEIEEWSAKARRGGPAGPRDADPSAPGSAGVIVLGS